MAGRFRSARPSGVEWRTAEDTGMAGQVAQESVVLPTVGAISVGAILGAAAVVAAAVAIAGNNDDSTPAATTSTR